MPHREPAGLRGPWCQAMPISTSPGTRRAARCLRPPAVPGRAGRRRSTDLERRGASPVRVSPLAMERASPPSSVSGTSARPGPPSLPASNRPASSARMTAAPPWPHVAGLREHPSCAPTGSPATAGSSCTPSGPTRRTRPGCGWASRRWVCSHTADGGRTWRPAIAGSVRTTCRPGRRDRLLRAQVRSPP